MLKNLLVFIFVPFALFAKEDCAVTLRKFVGSYELSSGDKHFGSRIQIRFEDAKLILSGSYSDLGETIFRSEKVNSGSYRTKEKNRSHGEVYRTRHTDKLSEAQPMFNLSKKESTWTTWYLIPIGYDRRELVLELNEATKVLKIKSIKSGKVFWESIYKIAL